MKIFAILALLTAAPAFSQLTVEQKVADFQILVSAYGRYYAPTEWKKQVFGFDLTDARPWLERVRQSKDDTEFWEICAEWIGALQDVHSSFSFPSNFSAQLGFGVDYYEGKPLVESINRTFLPLAQFPFAVGDEVVSIDGVPFEDLVKRFMRYSGGSNPISARRRAAARVTARTQSVMPRDALVGDDARVEIRLASGETRTFTMLWRKSGTPATVAGKAPPVRFASVAPERAAALLPHQMDDESDSGPADLLGYGVRNPVWTPPEGFELRQGRNATDVFYSFTYTAEGLRIGFIRIPNFSPPNTTAALRDFENEIAWMQENTDGLIVDVMRNNGGSACYNEEIQRRLIPTRFRALARVFQPTLQWIVSYSSSLTSARAQRLPAEIIAAREEQLQEFLAANREGRLTGPLPLCADFLERDPHTVVYTKPLMVLIDPFSTSAADGFPAVIQDNRRAPLFGQRTMGAGGTTVQYPLGVYSESSGVGTHAMHHRKDPIVVSDYPTSNYVENVGVRPDIEYDYMTRDNLLQNGRPFVRAFTAAIVEHIRNSQ